LVTFEWGINERRYTFCCDPPLRLRNNRFLIRLAASRPGNRPSGRGWAWRLLKVKLEIGDADFEVRPADLIGVDENVAIDHSVIPRGWRNRLGGSPAGDDSGPTSRSGIHAYRAIVVE
jgi:hypothetical protein